MQTLSESWKKFQQENTFYGYGTPYETVKDKLPNYITAEKYRRVLKIGALHGLSDFVLTKGEQFYFCTMWRGVWIPFISLRSDSILTYNL